MPSGAAHTPLRDIILPKLFGDEVSEAYSRVSMISTKLIASWRCTNPLLVAKCQQISYMTSCEFNEQKKIVCLLLKVDPLSSIHNNELITQVEELETSAKLRVFVIEYIIATFEAVTYFCFSYLAAFRALRIQFFLS